MAGTMASFRNRCSRSHRGSGGRQREGAVAAPAGPCLQYHPKTHHQAGAEEVPNLDPAWGQSSVGPSSLKQSYHSGMLGGWAEITGQSV